MIRETSSISDQAQVFVSYGRHDAAQVLEITRLLEQEGVSVWRDGDRILGGQYYGEQIVHAIAHSRVVVLMCSPQSFQSDNVHTEVLLTWDHYHRRYIPVWLAPPIRHPRAIPLLPGGLPVDRRPFPIAGAMAAAIAQGVRVPGRGLQEFGRLQPGGSAPGPPAARPARAAAPGCASARGTSRSAARTGSWSGSWGKGASARSGRPATPTCAACRRWP